MMRNRVACYTFDLYQWFVWTFWLGLLFGWIGYHFFWGPDV